MVSGRARRTAAFGVERFGTSTGSPSRRRSPSCAGLLVLSVRRRHDDLPEAPRHREHMRHLEAASPTRLQSVRRTKRTGLRADRKALGGDPRQPADPSELPALPDRDPCILPAARPRKGVGGPGAEIATIADDPNGTYGAWLADLGLSEGRARDPRRVRDRRPEDPRPPRSSGSPRTPSTAGVWRFCRPRS